ncbi:MAG: glycoside hydrolase family 25 protein [Ruminococcus flavefaciens]|nr:glycoside hydrolase family 25 protein [Ruminococcus flavefaciens]
MSRKNKKIRTIAFIEAILIIVLAVPLVRLTMLNIKSGNTVPTINTEPEAQTDSGIETEEIFYQNDTSLSEINIPAQEETPNVVIPEVPKNNYSFYKDKDKTTSIAGIDVSEFQGYIDWKQVKDSGIEFAFIRIGCRTYDDGGIILDNRFKENLYSADRAGIKTGVYFFSQALTVEEAEEEADAVIKAIEPFNITYPVVFDWEIIAEDYARTDAISIEDLSDCCVAFCERIKDAGYTPMIYQNKSTLLFNVDLPRINQYDIWLAEYNDEPTYHYDFKIWQYASDGHVPGISTDVDMNVSFKDYSKK